MTESGGSRQPDYRASIDPAHQPFRDPVTGEVVTLTPSHCNAIRQALEVYKRVAMPTVFDVDAAIGILSFLNAKSCLMARLLYDGKAPLVDAPPTVMAAPDYSLEVPRGDDDVDVIFARSTSGEWIARADALGCWATASTKARALIALGQVVADHQLTFSGESDG